jgi:hypothetical protein
MKEKAQQPAGDRHLDTPSESNREKHINFMEVEEESSNQSDRNRSEEADRERRKEWQEGLEEGRRKSGGKEEGEG